ncbi:hypothetical protein NQ318_022439 [Aromia moschata]|uniref:Uncharacterized protein n=1 Tax=Aromia moschata TaxID=1265417 RepID=A0AAV8Z5S1_9CUCU|nr:hypothetical protein NQ318_022439 [Aromia moschata]
MLHNVRDETYHRLGCCQQGPFAASKTPLRMLEKYPNRRSGPALNGSEHGSGLEQVLLSEHTR